MVYLQSSNLWRDWIVALTMALLQELCSDAPPFLADCRRNPFPCRRRALLVASSVPILRDSTLETLLEQATAGSQRCGGQRGLPPQRRQDEKFGAGTV